ncbi:hypothetical protein KSS87_018013 [Heliosperma pusillum]|nr:hypothetical protein KSS87_018013 [Heliosperma pusillum]
MMMATSTSFINLLPSSSSSSSYTRLTNLSSLSNSSKFTSNYHRFQIRAIRDKTKPIETTSTNNNNNNNNNSSSPEDFTKKYGLEAGKKGKSKGDQAKELLAKYGGAYLATSITLSLISFSLCYFLINAGVDVPALLQKVGIATNETGEKVGTFALAYAAHKAASPIRFPPTVALTPIVAGWIGKKVYKEK